MRWIVNENVSGTVIRFAVVTDDRVRIRPLPPAPDKPR